MLVACPFIFRINAKQYSHELMKFEKEFASACRLDTMTES